MHRIIAVLGITALSACGRQPAAPTNAEESNANAQAATAQDSTVASPSDDPLKYAISCDGTLGKSENSNGEEDKFTWTIDESVKPIAVTDATSNLLLCGSDKSCSMSVNEREIRWFRNWEVRELDGRVTKQQVLFIIDRLRATASGQITRTSQVLAGDPMFSYPSVTTVNYKCQRKRLEDVLKPKI